MTTAKRGRPAKTVKNKPIEKISYDVTKPVDPILYTPVDPVENFPVNPIETVIANKPVLKYWLDEKVKIKGCIGTVSQIHIIKNRQTLYHVNYNTSAGNPRSEWIPEGGLTAA